MPNRLPAAIFIALLAALTLLLPAARAQEARNHITATLVAEAPLRPGAPATLAFRMQPASGWHGYWRNPGDAGLGMTFAWTLPAGAAAGEAAYPVPGTLLVSGLMNHVFKGDYAVLVPLRLPAGVAGGKLPVTVKADWLACTDTLCVPESATLSVDVPTAAAAPDPRFDGWRATLPAPLGSTAAFALAGNTLRIGIPLPAAVPVGNAHVFIGEDRVVDYAAAQSMSRRGDMLIVEIPRAKFAPVAPNGLTGVIRLDMAISEGLAFSASPGTVPPAGEPLVRAAAPALPPLPWLLLGSVLGGLLLNIMPCVFPILSLKALSLARAGESEAHARIEGLAYAAGVIAACLALGGLLLALRAGGSEVGWAFQLQEPLVVAGLLLLVVAITANLLGLFEFSVPGFAQAGAPRNNAFATGLLAAFVATPCTGPFMAAAMGAALLLPVPHALALFAALGLGIALPFLAIAFLPALRRRLPRPGPWMVRFRRWMALPMGLTALALVWLASRLGGNLFALGSIALAAALLLLLGLAGRRQAGGHGIAMLVLPGLALLTGLGAVALPRLEAQPGAAEEGILPVERFSEAALAQARQTGKPVFAWFTADWCLTCKVNERVAIEREDVRDAFARAGVIVLKGDWTRRDAEITRYLTAQGAAGVPLYVWYPADGGAPRILPQVLGPDTLTALVAR